MPEYDRVRKDKSSEAQWDTSLRALTQPWSVSPWMFECYERWSKHPTVLLRAAALGLVYTHFLLPEKKSDHADYLQAKRRQPERLPSERAWKRAVHTTPERAGRLTTEMHAEVGSLRALLSTFSEEGECPAGELLSFLTRREQLELAMFPLIVMRRAAEMRKELRSLDAEAMHRFVRLTPIATTVPLMLSARKRPKCWWGRLICPIITQPRDVI